MIIHVSNSRRKIVQGLIQHPLSCSIQLFLDMGRNEKNYTFLLR